MTRSVIAAFGAAVIAVLGASSAAEAATIDFGVTSFDGSITFLGGSTLDRSTTLDLDLSFLVVNEILPGDQSGVSLRDDGGDRRFPCRQSTILSIATNFHRSVLSIYYPQ